MVYVNITDAMAEAREDIGRRFSCSSARVQAVKARLRPWLSLGGVLLAVLILNLIISIGLFTAVIIELI